MAETGRPSGHYGAHTELPPIDELGPAMRALKNDRHRAFVWRMLTNGGKHSEAAQHCGYASPANAGWKMVQDPLIATALHEAGALAFTTAALPAIQALMNVVGNPSHKDHVKAIDMVLSRTGYLAQTQVNHKVEHAIDEKALVGRVMELCAKHGLDPAAFLGDKAPKKLLARSIQPDTAVDAEFTDIENEDFAAI